MSGICSSSLMPRVVQFSRITGAGRFWKWKLDTHHANNIMTHTVNDSVSVRLARVASCRADYSSFCSQRESLHSDLRCQHHLLIHKSSALQWTGSRSFSDSTNGTMDPLTFEVLAEETLQNLLDFFEKLGDEEEVPVDFDVTYSSGVLTVMFGPEHGTYVINKQTPNKQIWLSSPTSGPKRYNYVDNQWIYSHDGVPMFSLLSEEISKIVNVDLDFSKAMATRDT